MFFVFNTHFDHMGDTARANSGLIDISFALMAFPTVFATLLLSPKVKRAALVYFTRLKNERSNG